MLVVKDNREEQRLKKRYYKYSEIIILVSIIYFIWILINIIGVYFIGLGNRWAGLSMNQWILSSIIVFSICLGIILFFFFHYIMLKQKIIKEKNKPKYLHGKRLYIHTYPEQSKGGVFSKTFIQIDDQTIVCIRYQLISPVYLTKEKQ
ncbi:MAG: hypothetical protein R6V50_07510 [Thermoplasmatota archaeon]